MQRAMLQGPRTGRCWSYLSRRTKVTLTSPGWRILLPTLFRETKETHPGCGPEPQGGFPGPLTSHGRPQLHCPKAGATMLCLKPPELSVGTVGPSYSLRCGGLQRQAEAGRGGHRLQGTATWVPKVQYLDSAPGSWWALSAGKLRLWFTSC